MSANPKLKFNLSHSMNAIGEDTPGKSRWEIRLGVGQLIILWSVLAVAMVIVFFFGLSAGKQQGIQLALDSDRGAPTVRMPIKSLEDAATSGLVGSLATPQGDTATKSSAPAPVVADAPKAGGEAGFDFSKAEVAKAPEQLPPPSAATTDSADTAGFLAKSANDTLKGNLPEGEKKLGSVEVVKNKTAESITAPKTEIAQQTQDPIEEPVAKIQAPVAVTKPVPPKKVEVAKVEAKKLIPPAVTKPVEGKAGWYVQLSASDTRSEATAVQSRVRSKGISADVREARVKGVLYFRVVVGPYSDRSKAEAMRTKVVSSKLGTGSPFVTKY